jgi:hypothetical protein
LEILRLSSHIDKKGRVAGRPGDKLGGNSGAGGDIRKGEGVKKIYPGPWQDALKGFI